MNAETPYEINPHRNTSTNTKYGDTAKNVFSTAWQEKYKKERKKKELIFEHYNYKCPKSGVSH